MYKLNIDTGGTFTDCIASSPEGEVRRRKVLSNSSLRAHIIKVISPLEIEISSNWGVSSDLFQGYKLRVLGSDLDPIPIRKFNPLTKRVILRSEIQTEGMMEDALIEITAGEEAPVLCARLITHTSWISPFLKWRYVLGQPKAPMPSLSTKEPALPCWSLKGLRICWPLATSNDPIFSPER